MPNKRNVFASRMDENEPEIVAALKAHGVSVQRLKDVGKGCPDLLVSFLGQMHLLEVKRDYDYQTTKRGKPYVERVKGKLTPDQEQWHAAWQTKVYIVRSPAEALAVFGLA